jgi:Cytochrome c oxidase subunit IV
VKVEGLLFAAGTFFFGSLAIIYWIFSKDPTGTTALTVTSALAFLIGYYLLFTARRIDPRPEDDDEAEISDGAGELGFFSPHSWWPLFTAASVAMTALGVVLAWWLAILGLMVVVLTAFGFVLEYYRGIHIP